VHISTDILTSQTGLDLYTKVYGIRRAEDLIVKHYSEDQMKTPIHMSKCQKAAAVAVLARRVN